MTRSKSTEKQPDHGSDGVRARILAAAREEFSSRGLAGASVRTITERAGVTAAMINYYFGGKDSLYESVVAEAQQGLLARLRAAAEGDRAGLSARLAGAYFDSLSEDPALQRLLLREVLDRGDGLRERAARHVGPLRALFESLYGDGDDAAQRAISLFGAVAGYFLYEPVLGGFLGADPRSEGALSRRRAHVLRLAAMFEEDLRCSRDSRSRST